MKKILIVEDDEFLADAYKVKFQKKYLIDIAHDGKEVLEKVKDWQPDLIILDIMMPKKDGIEVLKELRADKRFVDLPVIIASNLDDPSVIDKAKKFNIFDYIVKCNISINDLEKLCDKAIESIS